MHKISSAIVGIWLLLAGQSYAATKSLCPEKVIETGQVEGIYQGTSCEDFCYSSIKLDNGEDFVMFCGEEMAEKFFGKPSQRVTATYEVQQFWNELGNECTRTEVCKAGIQLHYQSVPHAAQSSLVGKYIARNDEVDGTLILNHSENMDVPYKLEVSSTNLPSVSGLCEASMSCEEIDDTLICKGGETTLGYKGIIVGKIFNNPPQIEIIEFPPELCGVGATLAHTYKKIH